MKELTIAKKLFKPNGEPYPAFAGHPGLEYICKLLDHQEDKLDLWLIFELCGKPLSKLLFDVRGEFYKGERIYSVRHNTKAIRFFSNSSWQQLRLLIRCVLEAISLFNMLGIVHQDLKPENILVKIEETNMKMESLKIIDFGSCFDFMKASAGIEITTPEYLSPEILEMADNKMKTGGGSTG